MNKLYKNSAMYLIATLFVKAATFLLVPFYSYLISPSEYGYIYIVVSFVAFMSLFVTCSLHGAISRFFWECETLGDVQRLYSTITFMVATAAIAVSATMLTFSGVLSKLLNLPVVYLRIAVFSSVLQSFYNLITALLYAKQEAKKISITSIVVGCTNISIQLLMVLNLTDKAMAMILSQLICSGFMFSIFLVFSYPYIRVVFDFQRATTYFKYSICQIPSSISVWLLAFSDRLLMNKIKGSSLTGIYGMGQTLGSIPKIVYSSINNAYVPFIFGCYKEIENGNNNKRVELKKHTTLVFAIVTIMVTLFIIYSNNIISLLDKRYENAIIVMGIMLFAMQIDCYRTMFMPPMEYNVKYVKVLSAVWCFSAFLNISLNIYLIPLYSLYGACFSMISSYLIAFLLIVFFSRKAFRVEYDLKSILSIFLISIIADMMMFIGSHPLLLFVKMIGTVVYIYIILCILNIRVLYLLELFVEKFKLLKK